MISIAADPAKIATAPTPDIIIAPIAATAPTKANIPTIAFPKSLQLTSINCWTALPNIKTAPATIANAAAPCKTFFISILEIALLIPVIPFPPVSPTSFGIVSVPFLPNSVDSSPPAL